MLYDTIIVKQRAPLSVIVLGPSQSGGGGYSPVSLFASGEVGDAWIPEREFCYTKTVGGIYENVTTTGDETARITGMVNNINADQDTVSKRPAYSEGSGLSWLAFDGVDDAMATGTITPGVDKVQAFVGLRKESDTTLAILLELGSQSGNVFFLAAPRTSGVGNYSFRTSGSAVHDAITLGSSYDAPISNIITGLGDISGDVSRIRVNGSQVAEVLTDQGTGLYADSPLYLGARVGNLFEYNGNMYGLITRFGPNLTDDQIADTETYMAGRVTL